MRRMIVDLGTPSEYLLSNRAKIDGMEDSCRYRGETRYTALYSGHKYLCVLEFKGVNNEIPGGGGVYTCH